MKTSLIALLVGLTSWVSKAQLPLNAIPNTREIVLNASDTIKKIHIFIANPTFRTNPRYFYSWYQKQQILHTQGAWSGKLLEGQYESFYPNHNLLEQGTYHRGYRIGIWKKWFPDGVLQEEIRWKHGLRHGQYQRFDTAGQLIEKGTYRYNQLHGMQITYANEVPTKVRYRKGNLVVKKDPSKEKKQPPKAHEKSKKKSVKPALDQDKTKAPQMPSDTQ